MKKRLLLILLSAALVVGSLIGANQFFNRDLSFNANVEALSKIEEGGHGKGKCWKQIESEENQLVLFCVSCIFVQADPLPWSEIGTCE